MTDNIYHTEQYWEQRYRDEGEIWGKSPSKTAYYALELFRSSGIRQILVPGSGYGRNTRLFSNSGFEVTGVEISEFACALASEFDRRTRVFKGSILDMSCTPDTYDAIYCCNVLHLFREKERRQMIHQLAGCLRYNGLMFFTVFSEKEPDYGQGIEVEEHTFESRPGRPAHYFTEEDLREHFSGFDIIEMGIMEDPEDHGGKPHVHTLRYIFAGNSKRK
jgi:SAM-dependent methyltransferase